MTMRRVTEWLVVLAFALLALGAWDPPKPVQAPPHHVPLRDYVALAAHADSEGISRGAFYGLAWMESRDGRCLPHCPRGQGVVTRDSLGHLHHTCREVGRMQINPCAYLDHQNPRCAYVRVRDNVDDNYACAAWYYHALRRVKPTVLLAFQAYNGNDPDLEYARTGLAKVSEWWLLGLLTPEDRRADK